MDSDLLRRISFQEGITHQKLMEELENRKRVLEWMRKHKIFQFDEVCRLINLYYKDRETLMGWVDKDISPHAPKRKMVVKKAWKPEKTKKTKPPPISHKPDLSYKPSKPKIEIKEILSKVKTKPFRMPKPERFLKPEKKKPKREKPKVSKERRIKKIPKPRTRKIKSIKGKSTTSAQMQIKQIRKLRRKIKKRHLS